MPDSTALSGNTAPSPARRRAEAVLNGLIATLEIVGAVILAGLFAVVMLGMGGVLAELKRSYCVRLAPVTEQTAMEMIASLPELMLIQGFRNLPRGDVAALARAIRSISLLACLDGAPVQEAEINPLIIRAEGQGAVAVDGLIALG